MTACACGDLVPDLESHLLSRHPALATRGLCPLCGCVVPVGHSSEGAAVEEHQPPARLGLVGARPCSGSGQPPHRKVVTT